MLSEISPVTSWQGDLLEPEMASNTNLMQVLDTLNGRYGRGIVKVSTQGAFAELLTEIAAANGSMREVMSRVKRLARRRQSASTP